jgi:hypothetical protein
VFDGEGDFRNGTDDRAADMVLLVEVDGADQRLWHG